MGPREAFKLGFLRRCVEDGVRVADMRDRVKQADGLLGTALGKAVDVGRTAFNYAAPLAIAAPPVLGGLGGFALAKATDVDDTDVDDVKDQEVIDEYTRQTAKLRRQKAVRDYRAARQRTGRIFL